MICCAESTPRGESHGRADRAHSDRCCRGAEARERRSGRDVLARLEGDRCPFRQLVEPRVPQVATPKRIGLTVVAEERPPASVSLELRDDAGHALWPTWFRVEPCCLTSTLFEWIRSGSVSICPSAHRSRTRICRGAIGIRPQNDRSLFGHFSTAGHRQKDPGVSVSGGHLRPRRSR